MAEKYPSAVVIGADTAPVQPSLLPPNLQFEVEDVTLDWLWPKDSFDFIHGRELILAIRDWPRLIGQAYDTLKPGGYLELSASVPIFTSDDDSIPPNTAYREVGDMFAEMGEHIGCRVTEPENFKQYMLAAGFTDVHEKIHKIPTNPWPKDPRLKKVGAFELLHFRDQISTMFARGYTQILGGDPVHLQVVLAQARNEVLDRTMHSYFPL